MSFVKSNTNLVIEGLMSHLAMSDKPKDSNGLWVIELIPSAKRSPYKKVVVSVNKGNNLPAVIEFISADESSYRIVITEFKTVATSDLSAFAFPKNRMQGVTVTDLR